MTRRTILLVISCLLVIGLALPGCGPEGDLAITLTVSSTAGGNVTTPGEGTFPYDAGTVVNLVATPDAGYLFVSWTGNVDTIANVTAATTDITMSRNYSVTANFAAISPVQYDLTISASLGGSVSTPGEGTFTYDEGTVVNLVATPGAGYRFVKWTGDVGTIVNANATSTAITVHGNYSVTASFEKYVFLIAANYGHTVGLKSDGTVVAIGYNFDGQCNVGGWTDVAQVAAGRDHTVGLGADGTAIAVGYNPDGRCNVGGWTDVVHVAAGDYHTAGVKSDGTVVAVGSNDYGQCNVGGWTDVVHVAAGAYHTVGLKSDGTVVAVGDNSYGQCNVDNWTDIVQVAAGYSHTVGLKSDGSVVAVGDNSYGQCNIGGWTGIIQVAACGHTVGLKSDGTVVAVGVNSCGQCNLFDWDLIP